MDKNRNTPSEILSFLQREEQKPKMEPRELSSLKFDDNDTRMDEVAALLDYSTDLEKKETRKAKLNRRMFMGTGVIMTAASAIWGMGTLLGAVSDTPLFVLSAVFGVITFLFASFFTLSRLGGNPLNKMRDKLDKMHERLVKPIPRPKPKGLYKSKRDRIIAGVASGLARRLGINAGLMRFLFLITIIPTSGASIALYLLAAIAMSFFPEEEAE